jgi:hypothetical protein
MKIPMRSTIRHARLPITLLAICVSCYGFAQFPGYQPVTDMAGLKTRFAHEAKSLLSIKAKFTQ